MSPEPKGQAVVSQEALHTDTLCNSPSPRRYCRSDLDTPNRRTILAIIKSVNISAARAVTGEPA